MYYYIVVTVSDLDFINLMTFYASLFSTKLSPVINVSFTRYNPLSTKETKFPCTIYHNPTELVKVCA